MYEEGFRWWHMGLAAAMAFVLFVIMLIGTWLQLRLAPAEPRSEAPPGRRGSTLALAVGAALTAGAAPVDGVGVVHAVGRGDALPAAPPAEPPDARALPRAVHAARPGARVPEQRRRRGRRDARLAGAQRDGRLRVREAALPRAASARSSSCSPRSSSRRRSACCRCSCELKTLGLVNTLVGVMIPGLASVFGIFLVRQYALSIPDELLDAARHRRGGRVAHLLARSCCRCSRPILVTLGVVHVPEHVERLPLAADRADATTALHAAGRAREPRRASTCRTPSS